MTRLLIISAIGVGPAYDLWDTAERRGWTRVAVGDCDAFQMDQTADKAPFQAILLRESKDQPARVIVAALEKSLNGVAADVLIAAHEKCFGLLAADAYKTRGWRVAKLVHSQKSLLFRRVQSFVEGASTCARLADAIRRWPESEVEEGLALIRHQVVNLLSPIAIDLAGWRACGFAAEYGDALGPVYSNRSGVLELERAAEVWRIGWSTLARSLAGFSELRSLAERAERIEVLLTTDSRGVTEVLEKLGDPQQLPTLVQQLGERDAFDEWFQSVLDEFDSLERLLRRAA